MFNRTLFIVHGSGFTHASIVWHLLWTFFSPVTLTLTW